MTVLIIFVASVVLVFGMVVAFGAPYLPTLSKQTEIALDLLDLKQGQTILELGCGDGGVLVAAARRGLNGYGYELNPILVLVAKARTWQYREQITVKWGNYWTKKWPVTDGMYVFLLQKFMVKLDNKLVQYSKDIESYSLVSYAFKIPGKKPTSERNGLTLYKY